MKSFPSFRPAGALSREGSHPTSSGRYENARARRALSYLAEREGLSKTFPGFRPAGARASLMRPNSLPANLSNPRHASRERALTRPPLADMEMPARGGHFHIWRRGRDSNPRCGSTPHTHFPGEPVRPLRHLSEFLDHIVLFIPTAAARRSVGITPAPLRILDRALYCVLARKARSNGPKAHRGGHCRAAILGEGT